MQRPGIAVLSASFDPGWTATVDGHPQRTMMVAPALVATSVPVGNHTVAFRYRGYPGYPVAVRPVHSHARRRGLWPPRNSNPYAERRTIRVGRWWEHGVTALDAAPDQRNGTDDEWTENRPPRRGLPRLELEEAWQHRDLGLVLAQRTLKLRYRQTLLGVAWAVLQPVAALVIFTIVFGRLAKLSSEGLPYAVFVYPATCLWTYMSASVSAAAAELPQNPHLVTRVYFPRILSPAAAVVPGLLDFTVAVALTPVLFVIYDIAPGPQVLLVPLWMAAAAIVAFGVGTWLAAVNVKYRDVRQILPFLLQTWFFLSPMVFSSSLVTGHWRTVYALNPLVGLVDGLRWSLVGGTPPPAADIASLVSAVLIVVSGLYYFRRVEVSFADVI
jgi:lipopolysaccharide transport system permease protein